jgi:hypothetical protein
MSVPVCIHFCRHINKQTNKQKELQYDLPYLKFYFLSIQFYCSNFEIYT